MKLKFAKKKIHGGGSIFGKLHYIIYGWSLSLSVDGKSIWERNCNSCSAILILLRNFIYIRFFEKCIPSFYYSYLNWSLAIENMSRSARFFIFEKSDLVQSSGRIFLKNFFLKYSQFVWKIKAKVEKLIIECPHTDNKIRVCTLFVTKIAI